MKRLALMYYEMGYGCGQCIIKAADRKYKIGISSDFISAAAALGNGCGYGGQCTVMNLEAGTMILTAVGCLPEITVFQ